MRKRKKKKKEKTTLESSTRIQKSNPPISSRFIMRPYILHIPISCTYIIPLHRTRRQYSVVDPYPTAGLFSPRCIDRLQSRGGHPRGETRTGRIIRSRVRRWRWIQRESSSIEPSTDTRNASSRTAVAHRILRLSTQSVRLIADQGHDHAVEVEEEHQEVEAELDERFL